MKYTKGLSLLLLTTLLSTSFFIAHAAGGRIEGKVTDPKGAAIPAATVIITNQITKQDFTTVTDGQGKYKVEGLPAGTYIVRVAVKGFNEGRREDVAVEDDATITIDLRLEIAPVEAEVKVTGLKGNVDPVYQSLRQLGRNEQDFAGPYAVVNNLQLKRDAANFTLKSGELYFITPIQEKVTAAVFIGDGELSLTPPTEIEKHSLKNLHWRRRHHGTVHTPGTALHRSDFRTDQVVAQCNYEGQRTGGKPGARSVSRQSGTIAQTSAQQS